MRFQLRDGMAVSRNWSNLDAYVRLEVPAGESVTCLVGPAASQGYYAVRTEEDAADLARAEAAGVRLPGMMYQIIIDFSFPENTSLSRWVRGPFPF